MRSEILVPPSMGTVVWLHSLKTLWLNGQPALVCQSDAASESCDRCTVELLEGRKVISVRLGNLALCPLAHFHIREAPGKTGLGIFATQDMPAGVRILSEAPILNMPLFTPPASTSDMAQTQKFVESSVSNWEQEVSALSSAQQAAFYHLYDCKSPESPTTSGIVLTNSFNIGLGCCVFLLISRFNHSCLPNCSHGRDNRLGRKFVYTDRDIKCGEELTLSYFEGAKGWSDRQAELQWKYRFNCDCQVCKLTGSLRKASDNNRAMAAAAMSCADGAYEACNYKKALRLVVQFLALLEKEGIATPSLTYRAEYQAFQACKLDKQHVEARRWLELAYTHCVMAGGPDTAFAVQAARELADPVTKIVVLENF